MILEVDHWYMGYSQILQDCRAAGLDGYVLLLCHADVDAMAAARILTYMLRADHVPYQLQACPTHAALTKACLACASSTNSPPAAIVLLNVGGTRNLSHLFGLNKLSVEQTKLYVMDGRRPVHLANIYAEEHLVVFWDPTHGDLNDLPSDGDNLSGNDDDDDDDESESSESEEDSEREEEMSDDDDDEMEFDPQDEAENIPSNKQDKDELEEDVDVDFDGEDERDGAATTSSPTKIKKKKKTKRSNTAATRDGHDTDSTQDLEDDLEEAEDEEEDLLSSSATHPTATATTAASSTQATQQQQQPALTPVELHRQRLTRLRQYYIKGNSYGSPSSFVAWRLASSLRFANNADLLWLAMVGVTDAYLQARLDVVGYAHMAMTLQHTTVKLFPPQDVLQRVDATVYAEELLLQQPTNDNNNNSSSSARTKLTFSEQGRIVAQTDYKFFLLRHWSLYDSMVHSPYVSTQLQLWTKPGMQRLQELLARMGYPLDECKQPFCFMKPSLRRRLTEQMTRYVEEFGLDELEFTSFFRVTGFSSLTSASDTAYAVTALLECPIRSGSSNSNNHTTTIDQSIPHNDDAVANNNDDAWNEDCFHAAYDALGPTSDAQKHKLKLGTTFAKNLQSYILQTAVSLVSRGAITRLRHFRYAYITCSSSSSNAAETGMVNPQQDTGEDASTSNNYHVLAKPLALTRLAVYLMDMHRANGKWVGSPSKLKPLVLLAEQPANATYLVVGMEMPDQPGHLPKNKLGQHFGLVAQTLQQHSDNTTTTGEEPSSTTAAAAAAVARLESFDAHVVEVAATHAQRFLEQLHYLMEQA